MHCHRRQWWLWWWWSAHCACVCMCVCVRADGTSKGRERGKQTRHSSKGPGPSANVLLQVLGTKQERQCSDAASQGIKACQRGVGSVWRHRQRTVEIAGAPICVAAAVG